MALEGVWLNKFLLLWSDLQEGHAAEHSDILREAEIGGLQVRAHLGILVTPRIKEPRDVAHWEGWRFNLCYWQRWERTAKQNEIASVIVSLMSRDF